MRMLRQATADYIAMQDPVERWRSLAHFATAEVERLEAARRHAKAHEEGESCAVYLNHPSPSPSPGAWTYVKRV